MHKRERHLAMLNDNRTVRPFEWGTEFVERLAVGGRQAAGGPHDPQEFLSEFSKYAVANSDTYFGLEADSVGSMRLAEGGSFDARPKTIEATNTEHPTANGQPPTANVHVLNWPSEVKTPSFENNTAYGAYFPHESHRAAVVVLPHWNAKAGTYFDLCRFFNKVGLSALRLTLPYHEERMPSELERADYLVSPNIGRSLQSIRQAVLDTRTAVRWLKEQGYQKVGVVGTSIGSCVAFLAFVHDKDIDAAVFNHVSGYMADVVWHGLSTYHVRNGFADNITLEELREYWLPVSPMAYMQKLAAQPARPQRYIYTLYDLSFPVHLSRRTMQALKEHKIKHSKATIPCGHYTLGEKPWIYLDGYKIIRFLHKNLK